MKINVKISYPKSNDTSWLHNHLDTGLELFDQGLIDEEELIECAYVYLAMLNPWIPSILIYSVAKCWVTDGSIIKEKGANARSVLEYQALTAYEQTTLN